MCHGIFILNSKRLKYLKAAIFTFSGNSFPDFVFICLQSHTFFYISEKIRAMLATIKHITTPHAVGIKNAAAVHLKLFVSFATVHNAVAHGKWQSEKSIVHIAVTHVHPFSTSRLRSNARFVISVRLPMDK